MLARGLRDGDLDADHLSAGCSSRRSQAARQLLQFHGGIRVLRPIALEDAMQRLHGPVLQFGARAGIMDPPVAISSCSNDS